MRRLVLLSIVLLLGTGGAASGGPVPLRADSVELVVGLVQPPLARAVIERRGLASARTAEHRLDLRAPAATSYLRQLAAAQRSLAARITEAIPGAEVRWRYEVVANALAVVVPRSQAARLARVRGVATVFPSVRYHAALDRSPQLISAPALWGSSFETAGNDLKIGIIDEGVDQTHPFFDPSGYTMPAGFPKGNTAYTTAKVIVARAFAPAKPTWKYAGLPFDPQNSEHGTHVAGIAAGNHGTFAGRVLAGIAPNAYIGNYKALTIPTPDFGLDGNSPEIAAAIEAAVRDGMDVINLSLGEPEVEPGRDLVVEAINAAADAGVVPVIAAGNDFQDFGDGSIGSPGTAAKAITVAATTNGRDLPADELADFSSAGPTPISLQLKPDVSAPGENVLSSLPKHDGLWGILSGTSMASPMVAGAAALLKERHPTWTVAQIKSALTLTGDPVHPLDATTGEVATTREGGGRVNLARANAPLVFTDPSSLSLGLLRAGSSVERTVSVTDAGGGVGDWSVAVQAVPTAGLTISVPPVLTVPGSLSVTAAAAADAAEGDVSGFLVLTHGTDTRRIPFWLRSERPQLGSEPATRLTKPGVYHGNTAGKPSLVSSYRYPEPPNAKVLGGPEQVYHVHIGSAANFGVAITSRATGVKVEPRIVVVGDENRLAGYTTLPLDFNPYRASYGRATASSGVVLPAPGDYDIVFDTPSGGRPGRFTFRYWIGDSTPPAVRLLPRAAGSRTLRVAVSDQGSGVDPSSIVARIDGKRVPARFSGGLLKLTLRSLARGRHSLSVTAADLQEAKNMENVGPILPNTRLFTARFRL